MEQERQGTRPMSRSSTTSRARSAVLNYTYRGLTPPVRLTVGDMNEVEGNSLRQHVALNQRSHHLFEWQHLDWPIFEACRAQVHGVTLLEFSCVG